MAVSVTRLSGSLAPAPSGPIGATVGYARAYPGTPASDFVQALEQAGCDQVFSDERSGPGRRRDEFDACMARLSAGDVLVVPSLYHLGTSVPDLITAASQLRGTGAGFRSLLEQLDTTADGGHLVFDVLGAIAAFSQAIFVADTRDGLAAARARGVRLGRPPAMDVEQVVVAQGLRDRPGAKVTSIARRLQVSRTTLYKYLTGPPGPAPDSRDADSALSHPTVISVPYQTRPGRGVLVAERLAELCGPASGLLELPLRLFWSAQDRTFNLGDPDQIRSAYETVLGEASTAEHLALLNGRRLVEIWPALFLPKAVRRAWEEHHPALRPIQEAA